MKKKFEDCYTLVNKWFFYILIVFLILFISIYLNSDVRLMASFAGITGLFAMVFFTAYKADNKEKDENKNKKLTLAEKLKNAERDIVVLKEQLEELKESNQSKDEFLKILAHDLKSPINSILGLTELIRLQSYHSNDQEEMSVLVNRMDGSCKNVKMLIENLLGWCLRNEGKLAPRPQKTDLAEVIDRVISIYHYLADEKKVKLVSKIEKNVFLFVDMDHMFTLIRNIVNNALKYSYTNGVVELTVETDHFYGHIKIKDNGIGISPNKIDQLLQGKVERSEIGTHGELGNGLGLAICSDLIVLNQGKISINSELGKGSEFIISIPAYSESKSVE